MNLRAFRSSARCVTAVLVVFMAMTGAAGSAGPAGAADPGTYTWTTGVVVIGAVGNTHAQPLAFNQSVEAQDITLRLRTGTTGTLIAEATRENVPPGTSAELDLIDTVCIDDVGTICGITSVVAEVVAATDAVVPSGTAGGGTRSHRLRFTLVGPNGVGTHGELLAQTGGLNGSVAALQGGIDASLAALESTLDGQLDTLAGDLDATLDKAVTGLTGQIGTLSADLGDRLDAVDGGLAEVRTALEALQAAAEQSSSPVPAGSVSTLSASAPATDLAATGAGWAVLGLVVGAVLTGVGGSITRLARRRV